MCPFYKLRRNLHNTVKRKNTSIMQKLDNMMKVLETRKEKIQKAGNSTVEAKQKLALVKQAKKVAASNDTDKRKVLKQILNMQGRFYAHSHKVLRKVGVGEPYIRLYLKRMGKNIKSLVALETDAKEKTKWSVAAKAVETKAEGRIRRIKKTLSRRRHGP